MKSTKKWGQPISSKTGEPLKPFIKPRDTLLRGIIVIAYGFFFLLVLYPLGTLPVFPYFVILIFLFILGCVSISRAKLGNKHVLAHQIIILISDIFIFIMGFVFSIIIFWSTPNTWSIVHDLLGMVGGIIIIIVFTLSSIIHCVNWLVKLEKYKVKNEVFRRDRNSIII